MGEVPSRGGEAQRRTRPSGQGCVEGETCVAQRTRPWGTHFLEGPLRALCSQAGRAQVSSHPAPPQASWLRGGSLCACRSQRQLSAHRGPFVLAASSARRAAGNGARSPHPLPRPPAVGPCHSRLARRPLAHRAGTGNCLLVSTSGTESQSRAHPRRGAQRPGTQHTRVLAPWALASGHLADLHFTDGETEALRTCLGWHVCVCRGEC